MRQAKQLWNLFAQAVTVFAAAAVVVAVFMRFGAEPSSYRDAVSKALPSVVSIYGRDKHGAESSIGSGVIVSRDGDILTNYHLIANISKIEIGAEGGETYLAELVGIDPDIDIAVLRVKAAGLPAIGTAEDGTLQAGDIVFAIGNPFGLNRTTTMGIVSAVGRERLGLHGFERFIQTDAAINPGSSGGALANAKGELVGINSALFYRRSGIAPQGIGFAIPAALAMHSYGRLVEDAAAPETGALLQNLSARLRSEVLGDEGGADDGEGGGGRWHALLVTRVWQETVAAESGLQVGDIVLQINDANPKSHVNDGELLPSARALEILRGSEKFVIDIVQSE